MALFSIKEPENPLQSTVSGHGVGIDLGTTHSLVATWIDEGINVLTDEEGSELIPSVVHYAEDGMTKVGRQAQAHLLTDPSQTFSSIKRYMGLGLSEVASSGMISPYDLSPSTTEMVKFQTRDGVKTPIEISAEILKKVMDRVAFPIRGAVIGVPAYFDDAQRQATLDAAKLANIPVFRLINEPTAAALAYHLDEGEEGVYLVYDFGGGTFDVTLLTMRKGVFEVLATGGDTQTGGDDIDRCLADHILSLSGENGSSTLAYHHVVSEARRAKEALSTVDELILSVPLSDNSVWTGTLSSLTLNRLIAPLVEKTLLISRDVLKRANVKSSSVKNVIFVGGQTYSPYIRERVTQALGCEGLCSISPEKVVALGAGYLAEKLAGNRFQDTLILDVTPLSLGLEMMGGINEKIIPRNTTLPATVTQEFTTYRDNQLAMSLHIVQGERELAKDCRSLANVVLSGIPALPAGAAKIAVTFDVDIDGLLMVTACETRTGVKTEIAVKPSYGLSEDEITTMLLSSIEHAQDDMQARRFAQMRVEAEQLLTVVQTALEKNEVEISIESQEQIHAAMQGALSSIAGTDLENLKQAVSTLEQSVEEFFARRLQQGLNHALKGQKIREEGEALEV